MADLNPASPPPGPAHSQQWLQQLQAAADRHLLEKSQIRDTLGLLQVRVHVPQLHFTLTMQIYHRAKEAEQEQKKEEKEISKRESPRKRLKTSKSEDTVD